MTSQINSNKTPEYFKLDEFPFEIIINVLKRLDIHDLISIICTNTNLKNFGEHDFVWKKISKKFDCLKKTADQPIKQQIKDYIEDLKIKVNKIQGHLLAPKDLEDILSEKLTIERGVLLNQFATSWSRFIVFRELSIAIDDNNILNHLNNAKTSDEISILAKQFSSWFEKNQNQLNQVTMLDLSNKQITIIPPEIRQLTNLHTLEFKQNQITAIPIGICQLTNLITLDLDDNQITTIPDKILLWNVLCENVERIKVSNNPIRDIVKSCG